MRAILLSIVPLILLVAVGGCRNDQGGVPNSVAEEFRSRFLAADPPGDANSVAEIRAQLAANDEAANGQAVVMTGTIGKMPNPFHKEQQYPEFPWDADSARFFVVDDQTVAEFAKHGHAKGEECSFCLDMAGRRADRVALVEIRQENGELAPYRADALLDLKEGDHVVIEGTASLIMETMLVVTPDSIYVGDPPNGATATPEDSQSEAAQSNPDAADAE